MISSFTILLIVFVIIVFIAMAVAIFKFLRMVNETKSRADGMSEEELESYLNDDEENS